MSYGVIDATTQRYLDEAGVGNRGPDESDGCAIDVAIIFDGALDESFLLHVDEDFEKVARTIFERLCEEFPTNDIRVETSHVYILNEEEDGYDAIEGSGYLEDSRVFEREGEKVG